MRRNRNFKVPPIQWVDLIEHHEENLARVRMLWRRGGSQYRPMIPSDALDEANEEAGDWDALELEETHFEWSAESTDSPAERRERISEAVEELWELANQWTRAMGSWCDFQLVGYDADDHQLFADGKRCNWKSSSDSGESEDSPPGWESDRSRRRDFDRRMDSFLDRMSSERDKSFETARNSLSTAQQAFAAVQESIDAAPHLLSKASEVLKEAIEYQSEQNRQIRDQSSGRLEMRAKAFAEMEKSRRTGMIAEVVKYAVDAGIANLLPFAHRMVEVWGNRNVTVFPEFKTAQQAMAYLVLDLTPFQLRQLFGEKSRAGGALIGLLDQGSKLPNERDALLHIVDAVRTLRSEEFRGIATPEQQLAARYIIGRLALYRMADYGEDEANA